MFLVTALAMSIASDDFIGSSCQRHLNNCGGIIFWTDFKNFCMYAEFQKEYQTVFWRQKPGCRALKIGLTRIQGTRTTNEPWRNKIHETTDVPCPNKSVSDQRNISCLTIAYQRFLDGRSHNVFDLATKSRGIIYTISLLCIRVAEPSFRCGDSVKGIACSARGAMLAGFVLYTTIDRITGSCGLRKMGPFPSVKSKVSRSLCLVLYMLPSVVVHTYRTWYDRNGRRSPKNINADTLFCLCRIDYVARKAIRV